jgi:hypothetical protein
METKKTNHIASAAHLTQQLLQKKKKRGKKAPNKHPIRADAKSATLVSAFRKTYEGFDKKTRTSFQLFLVNNSKDSTEDIEIVADPVRDSFLAGRSALRSALGTSIYRFHVGGYSPVIETAGGVPNFSVPGQSYINMALSATNFPNLASYVALFDEMRVTGMTVKWIPYNRYNHGASTNTGPWVLYFDDEAASVSTASTATALKTLSEWPIARWFSPDSEFTWSFKRPLPVSEYTWVPTGAIVTTSGSGTAGSLNIGMDTALNTTSTTYGSVTYYVHVDFVIRV